MNGVWISSQDREALIYAISVKVNDYSCSVMALSGGNTLFVGSYNTRKRCKEVVNEIKQHVNYGLSEGENHISVYDMPAE
jgi:hypothetical protein